MWPFDKTQSEPMITVEESNNIAAEAAHLGAVAALEEANASATLELAKEDAGWSKMGEQTCAVYSEEDRCKLVKSSRWMGVRAGIPKQIIALWRNYPVGGGIEWKAQDGKPHEVLTKFWKKPENKPAFSFHGQRATQDRKLMDGELLTALFAEGEDDIPTVRWLDTLDVGIATDPDDKWTNRWYVRRFTKGGQEQVHYYKDWTNTEDKPGVLNGKTVPPTANDPNIQSNVVVFHTKLSGSPDLHGYPILTTAIDWSTAYRRFMRSRVAIQQALAVNAMKLKGKGGQKQVTAMADALKSGLVTGNTENNPVAAPGATWVENQSTDLTAMKQETAAQAAQIDGKMLIMQQGVGEGIFPHWFGHDSAILATATMMESPMLRQFEAERQEVHDYYAEMFDYVLMRAGVEDPEQRTVAISSMEVNMATVDSDVDAMDKLLKLFPQFLESPQVQKQALQLLKQKDVDEIIKSLKGLATKRDEDETEAESKKRSDYLKIAKALRESREAGPKGE